LLLVVDRAHQRVRGLPHLRRQRLHLGVVGGGAVGDPDRAVLQRVDRVGLPDLLVVHVAVAVHPDRVVVTAHRGPDRVVHGLGDVVAAQRPLPGPHAVLAGDEPAGALVVGLRGAAAVVGLRPDDEHTPDDEARDDHRTGRDDENAAATRAGLLRAAHLLYACRACRAALLGGAHGGALRGQWDKRVSRS